MLPDRDDHFPGRDAHAIRRARPIPLPAQDEAAALLPDHVSQQY